MSEGKAADFAAWASVGLLGDLCAMAGTMFYERTAQAARRLPGPGSCKP
jgi:hypothetical protein